MADDFRMIQTKLSTARRRGYFRTIDLFAGAGGLSLGFHRAGFRSVAAIEIDDDARETHSTNFAPRVAPSEYLAHRDITGTNPMAAVSHLGDDVEHAVDVVVGGPPCQPFSRLGRAALWDLAGRPNAHADDPRATMYEYFLDYVERLRPVAFVMENVREMGRFHGRNLAHEIAQYAESKGYSTRYSILNAVWYGVPQLRERMIIIGIHRSFECVPQFPLITHDYNLPVGYTTSRAGTGRPEVLPPFDYYVDHFMGVEHRRPAVTAGMAFADLPSITYHLDGRTGRGRPRPVDELHAHQPGPDTQNAFVREMTNWPDFETDGRSSGHVVRFTPRDYETFRRMPHGGMYPEALATAEEIFRERRSRLETQVGHPITEGSEQWENLRRQTVPPYRSDRYPNKFRKMWPDQPARTVPAHIGKDSYSHIHFDSDQARTISLREAARLQSFPDGFRFRGSMNSQLRQIGNAVPPLLAFAIASALRRTLEGDRFVGSPVSLDTSMALWP